MRSTGADRGSGNPEVTLEDDAYPVAAGCVAVEQRVRCQQEGRRSDDAQPWRGGRHLRISGSGRIAGLVATRGAESRD